MFVLAFCILCLFNLNFCPGEQDEIFEEGAILVTDNSELHASQNDYPNEDFDPQPSHLMMGEHTDNGEVYMKVADNQPIENMDSMPCSSLIGSSFDLRDEIDDLLYKANWKMLNWYLENDRNQIIENPNLDPLLGMERVFGNFGYVTHFYLYVSNRISGDQRDEFISYLENLPMDIQVILNNNKQTVSRSQLNLNRQKRIEILESLQKTNSNIYNSLITLIFPPFLTTEVLTISPIDNSANKIYQFCYNLLESCDCRKIKETVIKYLGFAKSHKNSSPVDANVCVQEVELISHSLASRFLEIENIGTSRQYISENKQHLLTFSSIAKVLNPEDYAKPRTQRFTIDTARRGSLNRYNPY